MNWNDYLEAHQPRFVDELLDLIRIPSVSAIDAHKADVVRAGEWVVNRLTAAGIENVVMVPTAGHPVVYGDWLHAGPDRDHDAREVATLRRREVDGPPLGVVAAPDRALDGVQRPADSRIASLRQGP